MVAYRMKLAKEPGGDMANATGVGLGFRDMRWFKPVRPGMTLAYSAEPIAKLDWPTRPQLGLLENKNEARDANGELMMSFVGRVLLSRKPKS